MKAITTFAAAATSAPGEPDSTPGSFKDFLGSQISKTFNLPQAVFASALENEISKIRDKIESLRDVDINSVTASWTDITASDMAELANIVSSKLFSPYERASKVIDENDFSLMDLEMLERKLSEKKTALMSQMVEEGIESPKQKPKKSKKSCSKRTSDDEQQTSVPKKKRKTLKQAKNVEAETAQAADSSIEFVAKGEHQLSTEDVNISVNSQVFE